MPLSKLLKKQESTFLSAPSVSFHLRQIRRRRIWFRLLSFLHVQSDLWSVASTCCTSRSKELPGGFWARLTTITEILNFRHWLDTLSKPLMSLREPVSRTHVSRTDGSSITTECRIGSVIWSPGLTFSIWRASGLWFQQMEISKPASSRHRICLDSSLDWWILTIGRRLVLFELIHYRSINWLTQQRKLVVSYCTLRSTNGCWFSVGSKFKVAVDSLEKLKSGKISFFPDYPKIGHGDGDESFFAMIHYQAGIGRYLVPKHFPPLDEKFPDLKVTTASEVMDASWKGK